MDTAKLVSMANQVATFHRRKPEDAAIAEIALHLQKFWEPRMRSQIRAYLLAGGQGLDANARQAILTLELPASRP